MGFNPLVVKSKLPPWSDSSLEAVVPHPKKKGRKVLKFLVPGFHEKFTHT